MSKPRGGNKEVRALIRRVEATGCEVRPAHGHWKVYKDGRYLTTIGGSASDHRAGKNCVALLRRLGVVVE